MPDTDIAKESLSDAEPQCAETEPKRFQVDFRAVPERLDKTLARMMPEHSRSRLQGWIEQGYVTVNDQASAVRRMLMPGDVILVWAQPAPESLAFQPEPVDFAVVQESPDWIVVDKPVGLVTHPGAGNWHGTLLNGLLHRYPELAGVARAGIVHRLDKDTSGLMVVARNEIAQTHLVRQLQERTVSRRYLALAHGGMQGSGTIDAPIGRDARVPVRMSADRPIAPKTAITHYAPQRSGVSPEGQPVTEVACRLETGRTHQIRVHLAHLGHPLLGDALYGGKPLAGAVRQMLHARALAFQDPGTDQQVQFHADPPPDFQAVCDAIAWQA